MSITASIIVMFIAAGAWVLSAFLNRSYNLKGGRDPIRAYHSVSQWDPAKWEITSTCTLPPAGSAFPGSCVVEGLLDAQAYQEATHWCQSASGICIDPDTGENVKNNPIPFPKVVCGALPFCGWSQCIISFGPDDKSFVGVTAVPGPTLGFTLSSVGQTQATVFYMERLNVGLDLQGDQNGLLARFYMFSPPSSQQYTLAYRNDYKNTVTKEFGTTLVIQQSGAGLIELFVLMEEMPTAISSSAYSGGGGTIVKRKILAFGGINRTAEPSTTELTDFNQHVKQNLWKAAQTYYLVVLKWMTDANLNQGGGGAYLGFSNNTYTMVLDHWNDPSTDKEYLLTQQVLESRLKFSRLPFYTWQS